MTKLCFCLILAMTAHAASIDRLEQCLIETWGVDAHTVAYLKNKLVGKDALIDDFIAKSKGLIDYSIPRDVQALPADDAILSAPNHHLVIFENLYVRILWGSTLPKEEEPAHKHPWKRLMVVLKPADFKIDYPDGNVEIWKGEVGVYYELPTQDCYACTNMSDQADESLSFEVKE